MNTRTRTYSLSASEFQWEVSEGNQLSAQLAQEDGLERACAIVEDFRATGGQTGN